MIDFYEIDNLSEGNIIELYNDVIELNEIDFMAAWNCLGYCICKDGYSGEGALYNSNTNNTGCWGYSTSANCSSPSAQGYWGVCYGQDLSSGPKPCYSGGGAYFANWGYCRRS